MVRPTDVRPADTATPLSRLVDDFLAHKSAKGLSSKTLEQYRYSLRQVFLPFARSEEVTDPEQLTPRALDRLATHLLTHGTEGLTQHPRGRLSKDTVHSYLRPVRWFCNWANSEEGGARIPGRVQLPQLPQQRIIDVLSRDELAAMLRAAAERGRRDELLFEVLMSTGIRAGELATLRPADLVRRDGGHFLRVQGKGDRQRLVPVSPRLFRSLEAWADRMLRLVPDPQRATVFTSARRSRVTGEFEPLTASGVLQIVKGLAEAAGIRKRVYPHLLRHSFATAWLQQGQSALLLKDILGHADLTMIQRHYGHLNHRDAYNAMQTYLRGTPALPGSPRTMALG